MRHQFPTFTVAVPGFDNTGCGVLPPTDVLALSNFSRNSDRFSIKQQVGYENKHIALTCAREKLTTIPELSVPPSGEPLEYIVDSLPSSRNRNQPLLPLESSSAADEHQM